MQERHSFLGLLLALIVGLAVVAAAQAPSRLPGQTAPATPGQTPEAAAQQPPTPLDKQEEPKQPSAPSIPAVTGENQQFIEIKVGANQTRIDPDVRDEQGRPVRSFLTPGKNVTADVSYFQDHAFGSKRIQVLGIYRNNNDPRVDQIGRAHV